jgi:hypothetical protein
MSVNKSTESISFNVSPWAWYSVGRTIAEAVSRWLPTAASRVRARVWQMGFVVDKVESEQVFFEYFGFPWQNRVFHRLLHHNHNHSGHLAEALRRADHPLKESCWNWNETEGFMEAAKAQNWAIGPQEKNLGGYIKSKVISFFVLWLCSPILGLGRLHDTFRFISVTSSRTVSRTPWTGD